LSKRQITIEESDFFETIKGATLLTETNIFNENNTMKSKIDFALINDSSSKMNGTLLSSFVTNVDGKQNSTHISGFSSAMADSLAYSNTAQSFNKDASRGIPMEIIESEEGDSSSKADKEDVRSASSDDDLGDIERFEEIDVKEVSISSSTCKSKSRKQTSLLSPQEIEQAHRERDVNNVEYITQCKDFIESGKYNLDDFKKAMGKKSLFYLIGDTSLYESMEVLNVVTKDGFNNYLETQLLKFHRNYDFDAETMIDKSIHNSSLALMETFVKERPTQEDIYYYAKYIMLSSRMEKEIPLVALAYIERLLTKTGILMNHWNWRRMMLISLTVASKVWDDESLENIHFPKAMPELSVKEINDLERIFLELIDYQLVVKGADYAKYYFILRSMGKEFEEPENIQMDPISHKEMQKLQKNSDNAEEVFKEMYKYHFFSSM
jgi:hypothetical protein